MGKEHTEKAGDPSSSHAFPLFNKNGLPNRGNFFKTFGLGREIDRVVQFGDYKGPAYEMLGDSRCPVGEQLAAAFKEGGIAKVEEQLAAISMLDERFSLPISPATKKKHDQKNVKH